MVSPPPSQTNPQSKSYPLTEISPTQPPKKRSAPSAPKKARQSKLAKAHDISATEENEIKEVFQLFATSAADFPNEKEGVIAREDVRKALVYVPLLRPRLRPVYFAPGGIYVGLY